MDDRDYSYRHMQLHRYPLHGITKIKCRQSERGTGFVRFNGTYKENPIYQRRRKGETEMMGEGFLGIHNPEAVADILMDEVYKNTIL